MKINKNEVAVGDIVFVSRQTNTSLDDFVGKIIIWLTHESKVIVHTASGGRNRVFINRCSHANETQKKEYFLGVLKG